MSINPSISWHIWTLFSSGSVIGTSIAEEPVRIFQPLSRIVDRKGGNKMYWIQQRDYTNFLMYSVFFLLTTALTFIIPALVIPKGHSFQSALLSLIYWWRTRQGYRGSAIHREKGCPSRKLLRENNSPSWETISFGILLAPFNWSYQTVSSILYSPLM